MPRSITIEYEGALPAALSKNGRQSHHWRTVGAETKNLREVGYWLVYEAAGLEWISEYEQFDKAAIHIHQFWCRKPLDVSGLAAASAPLVDAFVDAGVLEDDDPETVTEFTFEATRVQHMAQRRVTVTVTEVVTSWTDRK